MLLVDYDKTEVLKFHSILNQRVRPDDELSVASRNVATHITLAVWFERPGQEHNAVAGAFQNLASGKIMLLRQNLGRSHQCDLTAIFHGDNRGLKGHKGFARPHVALEQTPHGAWRLHISRDFLQHPLLRCRRMKRQYFLNRFANAIVELKNNSGLRFLLPPPEFETKLDEK